MNGKLVEPIRDDRTGLTLITVSGKSTVDAEFRDPFMRLRAYSAIGWVVVLAYLLVEFFWRRRLKVVINESS